MPLYKISWQESYSLETVIEATDAKEAKETVQFFTDGWLQGCAAEADIQVSIDDIKIVEVDELVC